MGPQSGVLAAAVEFLSENPTGISLKMNTDLFLPDYRKANAKEGEFHMMAVFLLEQTVWYEPGEFLTVVCGGKWAKGFTMRRP